MLPDLNDLAAAVREAAREELLPRFAAVKRELKSDGSVVTVADRGMQERMRETLAETWPAYRLLGEEMSSEQQAALLAQPGPGLWILDPLDGTSNFAAGIPFFSVSLALLVDGEIVLGIVYDPNRGECFAARKGSGAWLNGAPLQQPEQSLQLKRAIAAVDFKR
ncbi:MAG: inositol monophosphatase, partial [Gammaproteobacteria bacterium]|nr:inositol monophosphatase [Gammaproteobacteria bacterium]